MKEKQTLKDRVKKSEFNYAKEWNSSSDYIKEQGGYLWMSDFIKGSNNKILEIGCGNGNGTLELAKKGNRIISIEENPNCILIAANKLKESNISVKTILRGSYKDSGEKYQIKYSDYIEEYNPSYQVYIIEGNFYSFACKKDVELFKWLLDIAPFNGIICWLLGTHKFAGYNSLLDNNKHLTSNVALYRNSIQFLVARFKDILICEHGFIHYVDRVLTENINIALDKQYRMDFSKDLGLPYNQCVADSIHIGNLIINGGVPMAHIDYDSNTPIKYHESDACLASYFFIL